MTSLVQPVRVFVDPFEGTRIAVEARRWVWPLLILALCVSASGTLFSLRWDAAPDVIRDLMGSGGLTGMSEADLTDNIQTATRKALVGGIAKGIFLMPLTALLLACALWVVGWLFDRPAPFERLMSAAALALLPIALYHLIFTVCLAAQHSVTAARAAQLVPSHLGALLHDLSPKMMRVASAVDFFNLWSAGLLGLGFSAATGMSKGRAIALALVLYAMYAGVTMIGLPAMAPGGGK
ncbi:YIP1 family protein [Pyxidicoccus parkwayensis]|uniref:YIP1 family protein n=1 Tax=Pyxidicoccus parkwayensis TaxID=2813578 RepID=A0ABX7P593_9BACT|nr:YIP1 family protein [Pyxidicoccus parkwaysis]QSQ25590.1 YIP1 family protein [Pyxidicoccus parkwaysis]